jgi:hypothetical protein
MAPNWYWGDRINVLTPIITVDTLKKLLEIRIIWKDLWPSKSLKQTYLEQFLCNFLQAREYGGEKKSKMHATLKLALKIPSTAS